MQSYSLHAAGGERTTLKKAGSSRSVPVDRRLPGVEHLVVIGLLGCNASLVLNFGQFGGSFVVHALLELAAHCPVTLTDLAQNVSLMGLLLVSDSEGVFFMCPVLPLHFGVDLHLIVLSEPLLLPLERLLEQNILLTVLIDILEQVDSRLVFTAPLLLSGVPLFIVLDLCQPFDHLLVGRLVICRLVIMSLQLLYLASAGQPLLLLDLLDGPLALEGRLQKHLIALEFLQVGRLSQLLLSRIVRDEFQIALTIQHELLLIIPLLLLLLNGPLLAQHGLLAPNKLLLLIPMQLSSLLLPVQHGHSIPDLLLLLLRLAHLPLELLLSVELPKLRVNLLLQHLLLYIAPLVDELFLALNGRTIVVKLLVLLPQRVILLLELHVLATGDLISPLLLALGFEHLQPLEHLLTDLLRRLHIVMKFLLVDAVLGGEKLCQPSLSFLEVSGLALFVIVDSVVDDVLFYQFARLDLPVRLVLQVVMTSDVIHPFGLPLK